ncbi:CDP-diacylglycerol diphosphatase [Streptomyces racemochromogenes]|uniref:CDP-diacylglycerol diphosphatase n=1 Tax=Streptomyces racemochromogenes TaxID=67353 RepID=A0ABW7P8A6_9ACTN
MHEHKDADGLPRRRFVALSGALGAAALLAGAGTGRSRAAAAQAAYSAPSTDPCPPGTPPPGTSPCPPSQLQSLCGRPGDSDPVWNDVQHCVRNPQDPQCLHVTSDYVVLHGKPESPRNFLLSPTCRITGIECPYLESTQAPNYWSDAWDNARPGGRVPVQSDFIGLGINSQAARRFDQLHIHMAGVEDNTQKQLQDLERAHSIATSVGAWAQAQVSVTGFKGRRTYRALLRRSLDENLFALLADHVVHPPQTGGMAQQTLIVVPKKVNNAYTGDFYVLNSDTSLHDGTDTCDELLVYA